MKQSSHRTAFTLSELLIAVAILGLIATFTIPKVLYNVETQSNKAKFKEVFGAISQLVYEGVSSNNLQNANCGSYLIQSLSPAKICPGNSQAQGCAAPGGHTGFHFENGTPGLVMQNGAMVYGLDDNNASSNGFIVDLNGLAQPNTVGQDIVVLIYCYNPAGCSGAGFEEPVANGKVTYEWWYFTSVAYQEANKALFLSFWR